MTLRQCKYLIEVSKHNSISMAASELYVTQPSISKAIKELETELEITILERTNKGVLFTKEGYELLFYAKMLVEQSESVFHHFKGQKTKRLTKLSVSSQHYGFAIEATVHLMHYLNGRQYELNVIEGKSTEVIDDVSSGKSIIGILSISNLNQKYFDRYFISKALVFHPIISTRQHVFLRKEHPLASMRSVRIEQLKDYPCLTYSQNDMMLFFAESPINPNTQNKLVYVKDRGAMNDIISNTDGYNIGTGCIVENYTPPNIISIPLEGHNEIQIGYVKRDDQTFPEEINIYVDYLRSALLRSLPSDL